MKLRKSLFFIASNKLASTSLRLRWIFGVLSLILLGSCATYQNKIGEARNLVELGQYAEALVKLKALADQPSNDQLIYILDYATILQSYGDYKESNRYFQMADKMADIQDYTSLSLETGSFLFGEELVQYKGEDFEVILINAMTAINYLCLGDLENAMVEVRRLNEKLRRYRLEAKRNFTDNPLALYISAIIYEANKSWDDAAIAYESVYKLNPNYLPLKEDLIRINIKARRTDSVKKWKAIFPNIAEKPEWKNPNLGEVIVIYQQGWGPRKTFRPENARYPMMVSVHSNNWSINPKLYTFNGLEEIKYSEFKGEQTLFDVDRIAISSLNDQYASLVARRIGGFIAKELVAERIRKENPLLGDVAYLAMHLSDRADLRQWSTLPSTFRVYRATVSPGEYQFKINGEAKSTRLLLMPGDRIFVSYRTFL